MWVRSFLTCPDGVPVEIEEEFRAAFSPDEQTDIMACMKGMFCVNLWVNTSRHLLASLSGRPENPAGSNCPI